MKQHTNRERNTKEGVDMAAVTKPSVFEVITDNENFDKAKNKINEVRLSESFLQECLDVAKNLQKEIRINNAKGKKKY